jgi:hypothetical protein
MDGRIEIEIFGAGEDGRVKNLKIWVENPQPAEPRPKKRGIRSGATPATKRGPVKHD